MCSRSQQRQEVRLELVLARSDEVLLAWLRFGLLNATTWHFVATNELFCRSPLRQGASWCWLLLNVGFREYFQRSSAFCYMEQSEQWLLDGTSTGLAEDFLQFYTLLSLER